MSCGIGHRHGSDPALLWLWCRLAATPQTGPQAWEPPYATGTALEKTKKKKKKKKSKYWYTIDFRYIYTCLCTCLYTLKGRSGGLNSVFSDDFQSLQLVNK